MVSFLTMNKQLFFQVFHALHVFFLPSASVMCCQQSSWVPPESQMNGFSLWWLSNGRETLKIKGQVKIFKSNKLWVSEGFQHYLKIFNKTPTSFRWTPHTLRSGDGRQRWISHHALGTGEELSLQALQERWACAQLHKTGAGAGILIFQRWGVHWYYD